MFDQRDLPRRRVTAPPVGSVRGFGWLIKPWLTIVFSVLGLSPAIGQDHGYKFVLGTGDNLPVTVTVDGDLSRAVEVDSGGWIALPLVANAGRYACAGGMRIINAVAMAEGYTDPTKERDMLVARAISDGRQVSAGREMPVVPGDVIAVPERFI